MSLSRLAMLLGVFILTASAGASAPAVAFAQQIDPVQIHQALLQHPIVDEQLPPGFAGVALVDMPVDPENTIGEIGNIDVVITSGPDDLNGGAYTLFATPEQADAAIAMLIESYGGNIALASTDPLLDNWPTYLVTAPMPDPPMGVSAYLVRMDSVVVAAFSGILGQPEGNAENARVLALLMAEQVASLSTPGVGGAAQFE